MNLCKGYVEDIWRKQILVYQRHVEKEIHCRNWWPCQMPKEENLFKRGVFKLTFNRQGFCEGTSGFHKNLIGISVLNVSYGFENIILKVSINILFFQIINTLEPFNTLTFVMMNWFLFVNILIFNAYNAFILVLFPFAYGIYWLPHNFSFNKLLFTESLLGWIPTREYY